MKIYNLEYEFNNKIKSVLNLLSWKLPLAEPVIGLLVPGRKKPDIGLPEFDIGRMLWDIPPGWPALDKGLEKEVPGLGA